MRELHIDVESRAVVDLRKTGVHVYWEDPHTDLWVVCYSVDDDEVLRWFPGDPVPELVAQAVKDRWLVFGHNVNFERLAWESRLGPKYQWPIPRREDLRCTAAMAAAMALPRDLGGAAMAMGLDENKDQAGKRLMLSMAKPRRMENGVPYWWDVPERLERLAAYCEQDVRTERALTKKLRPLSDKEQKVFLLDMAINDRGVRIDAKSVAAAQAIVKTSLDQLDREIGVLTRNVVTRASQASRLAEWLTAQGLDVESVDKASVRAALESVTDPTLRRVLEIRQEAAKSSTAKLEAMRLRMSPDGRARENLLYHGAGTGRWSGKGIQLQNLPRPSLSQDQIEVVFQALPAKDPAWLELWGSPLQVVSDSLRGMIWAAEGHEFVMADFSAIEGRVLAWLAGEAWKLDAYRAYDAGAGPDLYKLAASSIYGRPVDEITKDERQIGKTAELALGYCGGKGAFMAMAASYGIEVSEERAEEIKVAWREANPAIQGFWYGLDDAAMQAVREPGKTFRCGPVQYAVSGNILWCRLPSGRLLSYVDPKLREVETPWGAKRLAVTYMGVNSVTRKWERCKAYGGLYAENITQAVARDIMAEAMLRVEARGWPVVLTVHDEVVSEVPVGAATAEEYEAELCRGAAWAEGLPLAAEGCVSKRYRK